MTQIFEPLKQSLLSWEQFHEVDERDKKDVDPFFVDVFISCIKNNSLLKPEIFYLMQKNVFQKNQATL